MNSSIFSSSSLVHLVELSTGFAAAMAYPTPLLRDLCRAEGFGIGLKSGGFDNY